MYQGSNITPIGINSYSNTTSEVYRIYFNPDNSDMYVSGYDHLARYQVAYYQDKSPEINEVLEIPNQDTLISWADNSTIMATDSYTGTVTAMNSSTMETISQVTGFDAPFKVIYSDYHGFYLVAGTNILWKLNGGVKQPVYSAKDYTIADIDCSEDGLICILLNGSSRGIIRVLEKDFYSKRIDREVDSSFLRFCKYCGKGIFYSLVETSMGAALSYQSHNYVIDTKKRAVYDYPATSTIVPKVTNVVYPSPTHKIEIHTPNGGETWLEGSTQSIIWASTESVNDAVSIGLYKGSKLVETLSSNNTNGGAYSWTISNSYAIGTDYKIRITLLTPGGNDNPLNYGVSNSAFTITNVVPTVVEQNIQGGAVGIGYSVYNNTMVIALQQGYLGFFDMDSFTFNGLYASGTTDVLSVAVKDGANKKANYNSKVRVFVGSDVYLSDMWDSGEIETDKQSIYYAGEKLISGKKYYVNLQTYSSKMGWSDIQTREFTMPK